MEPSDMIIRKLKSFEGLRLTAYKPVASEKYWTIGYGHYGADVTPGMTITEQRADELFMNDLQRFVCYVNNLHRQLSQDQFDALLSFCYNCGPGNLDKLTNGRTDEEIAENILLYNKDASGVTLPGLVSRRQWEHDLFVKGIGEEYVVTADVLNIRTGAGTEFPTVGGYKNGEKIRVLDTWYKTSLGWVCGRYCKRC